MSDSMVRQWAEGLYDSLDDTAKVAAAVAITAGSNAFFRRYETTTVSAFTHLLAARVGVELFGSTASMYIDDKRGLDNWFKASDTMFRNRTVLGSVPVFGSALTLVPNPLGVAEVLFESGQMIGRSTINPFKVVGPFLDNISDKFMNPPKPVIKFYNPFPRLSYS